MHKLAYLHAKFSNLHKQGTDEWLENRKWSFGGSEIATVIGTNPYQTVSQLFQNKLNKENGSDDARTWGQMFEPVSKLFIEKERRTTIHDFGSVPHPFYPVCYSPDGILIEKENLILLEIKNPVWRGVGVIPKYYLDQVLCGMCIFPADYCLFAQFQFRRCPMYTDSRSYSYDRYYHRESKIRMPPKPVIAFGYLYWNVDCEFVDLGMVDSIYAYVKTKKIPDKIIINEMFNPKRGLCLKWKLFDISYELIYPEPNYLKEKENLLWDQYKILHNLVK